MENEWLSNAMAIVFIAVVIVSLFALALVPGYLARGTPRHRDIRKLGLFGMIVPIVWLVALIWALCVYIKKPGS